ncbi:UDP-N-acetylglucosamine 2-epimerase (non-hydrolyzing) [Bacillus sp. IITD106]|nr:UDP-N-acetylglucosamine 2-epimerase (non-hydrolyzing) [Bacillus sp. IITD106]
MKKIVTVIGARPQFIKAAPVSRAIRQEFQELIVHTGQHYDQNMSEIFFDELSIPKPDFHLGVGSASHGKQTGEMMIAIEDILEKESPDYLLVYGDTNSTLAGALTAAKLHIPVVHIEAGLRSFNKRMPEEINRVMTDHVSHHLYCPTETAVRNLYNENIKNNVWNVGDVMYDTVTYNKELAEKRSKILDEHNLKSKEYYLVTIHRAENTDSFENISRIINAFSQIKGKKVWPIHPRTKSKLISYGIDLTTIPDLHVINPVGYLDMLKLENHALKILTDSGGVQKEAYFMEVPCITLRDQTEWVETLDTDANILVGTDVTKIIEATNRKVSPNFHPYFGNADASYKIVDLLSK